MLFESIPFDNRGSNMILFGQTAFSTGAVLSVVLAWIILPVSNWRVFLLVASIPLWGSFIASIQLDESPRWLIGQQKFVEAEEQLRKMAKNKWHRNFRVG
eukprot:UN25841